MTTTSAFVQKRPIRCNPAVPHKVSYVALSASRHVCTRAESLRDIGPLFCCRRQSLAKSGGRRACCSSYDIVVVINSQLESFDTAESSRLGRARYCAKR
jgi:hypothetical protein